VADFPELKKALESAHTIELVQPGSAKYKFQAFAFGERGTKITAELLKEITDGLCGSIRSNFPDFDYIVSPVPGGHTWGSLTALRLGKPINILRTEPSYDKGETEIPRKTGYYQHNLYFNHFEKGDRVLIIDDVVSTGGTLRTILEALRDLEVTAIGAQLIYAKTSDYKQIESDYSLPVRFLLENTD